MKRGILILGSICSLLTSCATQEEVISETNQPEDFVCGSYYDRRNRIEEENVRTYRAVSWIEFELVVKDSDTLDINELICVDSIKFTEELNKFEIREMCKEMGIQGKTYFRAKTNKYGGVEEVDVLKSVDHCFKDLEEKIKKKALTMRVIPEQAGTYEIIFYHVLRLD